MLLFCCINSALAGDEIDQQAQPSIDKDIDYEKKQIQYDTQKLPDKELLLFLSEFSDAQDDWVDPEVFNQSFTETLHSNTELEEIKNEDLPNNL